MLHLRTKRDVKPLSLPVLLSFNELAWIAVGVIVLVFVFFWKDYTSSQDDSVVKVPREKYAELTNRPAVSGARWLLTSSSERMKLAVPFEGVQSSSR